MFSYNAWNEEVVADGSGDSQYYYEYEGSNPPGGILGGVVATPFHFEYGDDKSWFSLDTAPSEIELTLVLGILGYVFAPQLQEMLDSKLWGYAHLAGMFFGGGTAAGSKALGWLGRGSKSVGHVFWSGGPMARSAAMRFAQENGMVTLEMTQAGKNLAKLTGSMPWQRARPMWETLSKSFSTETRGTAHFFEGTHISPNSIWLIEKNILVGNEVKIITHFIH